MKDAWNPGNPAIHRRLTIILQRKIRMRANFRGKVRLEGSIKYGGIRAPIFSMKNPNSSSKLSNANVSNTQNKL